MATTYIFKVKIKGGDMYDLDNVRGQVFKDRFDDKTKDQYAQIKIGEIWSGTWKDIAWIKRETIQTPGETKRKGVNDGKPTMTFKQFVEKHPDKVKLWENFLNKRWDGSKFVPR